MMIQNNRIFILSQHLVLHSLAIQDCLGASMHLGGTLYTGGHLTMCSLAIIMATET